MDIWTVIGIISSALGIFSFFKNDTLLFKKKKKVIHYITNSFLKKSIRIKKLIQNSINYVEVLINFEPKNTVFSDNTLGIKKI